MLKLDNNLLEELGLGTLPEDQKRQMLQHIYDTLELRVGTHLANQMTDKQLEEFERFIDAGGDTNQTQALQWLESNLPNYKQVVQDTFEALKTEVKQMAPQLLAAAQQQPQEAQVVSQPMPSPAPQQPYPQASPATYAPQQSPMPAPQQTMPSQPPAQDASQSWQQPQQVPTQSQGIQQPSAMPQPFTPPQPAFSQPVQDTTIPVSTPDPFAPPQQSFPQTPPTQPPTAPWQPSPTPQQPATPPPAGSWQPPTPPLPPQSV